MSNQHEIAKKRRGKNYTQKNASSVVHEKNTRPVGACARSQRRIRQNDTYANPGQYGVDGDAVVLPEVQRAAGVGDGVDDCGHAVHPEPVLRDKLQRSHPAKRSMADVDQSERVRGQRAGQPKQEIGWKIQTDRQTGKRGGWVG